LQGVEAHLSRPLLGPVAAGAAAPLSADRTLPPAQAILAPALRPDQPLNQRPLLPPVHGRSFCAFDVLDGMPTYTQK